MGLAEEDKVTNRPHGTETAPLGDEANGEADHQRDQEGGMHGSRSLQAVEEDTALRLPVNLGESQEKSQKAEHDERHDPPRRRMRRLGPPQVVPLPEEERPDPDPENQSQETEDGVSVPPGETEHGTPGTPQKDKRPDHRKDTQDKTDNRRGTQARTKFPEEIGGTERSQDKTDNLGTDILDNPRAVQTEGTGDIPLKTGHTDPHITRVSQFLQEGGKDADHDPHGDNPPATGKEIFYSHRHSFPILRIVSVKPPSSKTTFSISQILNRNIYWR